MTVIIFFMMLFISLSQEKSSLQDKLMSVAHQLERLKTQNNRLKQDLKSVGDELAEQKKELSLTQNLASETNVKCEDLTSRLTVTCLFLLQ
jgi:hypothetical protein